MGSLITEPEDPNNSNINQMIIGESFIKPKIIYKYKWQGSTVANWKVDKLKYPVKLSIDEKDPNICSLKWLAATNGQFELTCGNITKTIVVESLF